MIGTACAWRGGHDGVDDSTEEPRLAVTPVRGAIGLRPAIVLKLEELELPALLGLPCFKLLAAQFEESLPTEGMAVDDEGVGPGHGAPHAASFSAAGFCRSCRKSAARCACDAAVKIARLSFFSTFIHDAI